MRRARFELEPGADKAGPPVDVRVALITAYLQHALWLPRWFATRGS